MCCWLCCVACVCVCVCACVRVCVRVCLGLSGWIRHRRELTAVVPRTVWGRAPLDEYVQQTTPSAAATSPAPPTEDAAGAPSTSPSARRQGRAGAKAKRPPTRGAAPGAAAPSSGLVYMSRASPGKRGDPYPDVRPKTATGPSRRRGPGHPDEALGLLREVRQQHLKQKQMGF